MTRRLNVIGLTEARVVRQKATRMPKRNTPKQPKQPKITQRLKKQPKQPLMIMLMI